MRIAVVTGTRSEYGIWKPVLRAIAAHPKLDLQLIVTGMHLLRPFGYTIREIQRDGWKIAARVPMYRAQPGGTERGGGESYAAALARGTAGLARAFAKLNPDVVMVLGDRLEILAAANAALCQGRLIAHVHGGETAPGQFDEQIRHAVTKMAHLHFCATKMAGQRIIQMGENPARVQVVGAPALDSLLEFRQTLPPGAAGTERPHQPMLVLHPSSPNATLEYQRTKLILNALLAKRAQTGPVNSRILAIGPNNDPGHEGILRAYREHAAQVELRLSVSQEEFWRLAETHGLLVGNSSSGIIELASLRVAVINLGARQAGRERSGNVIDIPIDDKALRNALHRVLSDRAFRRRVASGRNVYGDGHAAPKIAAVLGGVKLARSGRPGDISPVKHFHDLAR